MGLLDFDLDKVLQNPAFMLGMNIHGANTGNYGQLGPALSGGMNNYAQQQAVLQQQALMKQKAQQERAKREWAAKQGYSPDMPEWAIKKQYEWQNAPAKKPLVDMSNSSFGPRSIDYGKGESKYIEERYKTQASNFDELEKSAKSAYKSNQALQSFAESSDKGDAGGAQPLITGAKNFLSSFGFGFDDLSDTTKMQQAIGQILGQKMQELGARGLTDQDMKILRESLPRVETDRRARIEVINVLQKANNQTISEYIDYVGQENKDHPKARFIRPGWVNSWEAPQPFSVPTVQVNPNSAFGQKVQKNDEFEALWNSGQ